MNLNRVYFFLCFLVASFYISSCSEQSNEGLLLKKDILQREDGIYAYLNKDYVVSGNKIKSLFFESSPSDSITIAYLNTKNVYSDYNNYEDICKEVLVVKIPKNISNTDWEMVSPDQTTLYIANLYSEYPISVQEHIPGCVIRYKVGHESNIINTDVKCQPQSQLDKSFLKRSNIISFSHDIDLNAIQVDDKYSD